MVCALTFAAALAPASPVRGEDRVAALTSMLASRSEKTRLSAVLALAKLGEPRVTDPLIQALGDASAKVRGVAATALGELACGAALAKLDAIAHDDRDADVRQAAATAAMKISSGRRAAGRAAAGDAWARRPPTGADRTHAASGLAGRPDLYVLVNSASDESPGGADPATRRRNADIIKRALLDRLQRDPRITQSADDAERWTLDARHVDLSVTRLTATHTAGVVEVATELRVAISDAGGKLLSFVSGGAKTQVPASKFDPSYLAAMRRDVLDSAMRGMFDKLVAQLRDPS